MATAKELQSLGLAELQAKVVELKDALFQDQLKLKTGALDNPSERATRKRDLARVLTVMTAKKTAEKVAAQAKK
jgi:large subunit ribosomal protein L29